jgi:hypothetical protein
MPRATSMSWPISIAESSILRPQIPLASVADSGARPDRALVERFAHLEKSLDTT